MPSDVTLRGVTADDLPTFFAQQLDPTANHMAAFTAKDPTDRAAFSAHWAKILGDPSVTNRTILFAGRVAGYVARFERLGEPEVCYWLGKEFWGQGVATQALAAFLREQQGRPLYARAAKDNIGSIRVLEKCGFTIAGYDTYYANARGQEIAEVILKLS